MEKVGIPLPKVKAEKVEKRGKYLKAVVDCLLGLGQGKARSYPAIVSRMQIDFSDFPWDNRPVIKKHLGMALKAGVEQGILVQQVKLLKFFRRFLNLTFEGLAHW